MIHDNPDGTPRKLMDPDRMRDLGWAPTIPSGEGIASTYRWFLEQDSRAMAVA